MTSKGNAFCIFVIAIVLFVGGGVFAVEPMARTQTLNLPDPEMNNAVADDDVPDVTARVARISFISGDVEIRRIGGENWEKAALNLPIVEGDEITTNADARLEIQFSLYSHLRLNENSYLKVVNLKDEGIAVSLSQGTLNLRLAEFDKDRSYFEIDAPKTTVAVQRAGMYRVDSGKQGDSEIRVTAGEDGEARVYSDNAGFTLKNGRSARVFIDGVTAGEWEVAAATRYADEFDGWALERDVAIAKHLKDAFYDKYYDNDIYGAEDLNDNGEWIHTSKYGYVWRPYRTTLSGYADWSPYRYGHWRWIPPFGWTWVNDEPWGWATYHHGRWFYDDGYWNWSPYGYYRNTRSWWSPALVVITIFSNNICWYPLPYHYGYYNYNWHYNTHNGGHHNSGGQPQGGGSPTPSPRPPVAQNGPGLRKVKTPPLQGVPPTGVITVAANDFGTKIKGGRTAPLAMANTVLSRIPNDVESSPVLPTYTALNGKISRDIKTERPQIIPVQVQTKTGATTRKTDAPLDQELRNSRIFGNRPPLVTTTDQGGVKTINNGSSDTRKTGAVDRPPVVKQDSDETRIKQSPVYTPPIRVNEDPQNPPVKVPRGDSPPMKQPPRYDPPPKQETPRYDPPPTKPPPRNDPPPPKSEPKRDPSPPADKSDGGKKKDG